MIKNRLDRVLHIDFLNQIVVADGLVGPHPYHNLAAYIDLV